MPNKLFIPNTENIFRCQEFPRFIRHIDISENQVYRQTARKDERIRMTIQEAGHQILSEKRQALDSKTIAKLALDRGLVLSSAQDPIGSLAQTLEKNIRENVYNRPQLVFIHEGRRRLISLPGFNESEKLTPSRPSFSETQQLTIRIPSELMKKIQLAEQARIGANFDDSVTTLLREGLRVVAPRIKEAIESLLKELPAG
jgi:hypothetical protein